jgi:hypothetical protein
MERKVDVLFVDATGEKRSAGRVTQIFWDQKERMKRALKAGGIFFGLAIVCIFLPLVHFVLVPLFLLATPLVATYIYGQTQIIVGGEGVCPECQAPFEVAGTSRDLPLDDLCGKCHKTVKVIRADSR